MSVSILFIDHTELHLGEYPISYPNLKPDMELVPPFLELRLFENRTVNLTLKGRHRTPGIFQITVFGKEGVGDVAVLDVAREVAEAFPANLKLSGRGVTLRVTEAPTVGGGFAEDGYWKRPVSIYYETLN